MSQTQCDRLYAYLAEHGSITAAEAYRELGIPAVMRRIHDLRRRGVLIRTDPECGINRYGEPCEYARYVLVQEQLAMEI